MTTHQWVHLNPDDLRTWRMGKTLTRRQLSMLFHVSTSTVRAYERGDEVPPEWLQDRMLTVICSDETPEITVPRGRHRRYRWSKLTSDTLYRWRRLVGLTQAQAAGVLGCSPASVSCWERNERAPKRELQRQLLDAIEGYDDGSFPSAVSADVPPTIIPQTEEETVNATPTQTTTQQVQQAEEGARRRAQNIMDRIDSARMPEKTTEARWGRADGFVVIRSNITGAHYLIESTTGQFFRTQNPSSNRIQPDRPHGVIHQDRTWLYSLFNQLDPEGKLVVARYQHQGQNSTVLADKKDSTTDSAPPTPAQHQFVDLKPTVDEKRVTLVERTGKLPIRLDHLHAMLKTAGVTGVPVDAKIDVDNGTIVLSWPLGTETVDS